MIAQVVKNDVAETLTRVRPRESEPQSDILWRARMTVMTMTEK